VPNDVTYSLHYYNYFTRNKNTQFFQWENFQKNINEKISSSRIFPKKIIIPSGTGKIESCSSSISRYSRDILKEEKVKLVALERNPRIVTRIEIKDLYEDSVFGRKDKRATFKCFTFLSLSVFLVLMTSWYVVYFCY